MTQQYEKKGIYLLLISVHGLIRGSDLELGRDADTGGQTKYVVELARALAQQPGIDQLDLFTRRIIDKQLSEDYGQYTEPLAEKANIVRMDAGPEGYIRKEDVWDFLDSFADNALSHIRESGRTPDIIHCHYADGGYVGVRLANILGVPLVYTGHSLGRVKRRRLLATGMKRKQIEQRYNMLRRIQAEEDTLAAANLVIASTANEIEEQYELYDYYQPDLMAVIPPGTDLERFHPPAGNERSAPIAKQINRFLTDTGKPIILALSRPDERKNITTLIEAYGESAQLQATANLVIVAGNRDDIRDMDSGAQSVLKDLLLQIDTYDLYGHVAYPKHHEPDEVPILYRLAAVTGGVFINPALTEPFGLTLIEAAASGLPIVATEDGGPQDIIGNCQNGLLIDPLDKDAMTQALLSLLTDTHRWQQHEKSGLQGVNEYYSWGAHATRYLSKIMPLVAQQINAPRPPVSRQPLPPANHEYALFSDLDQNLLGDPHSLKEFVEVIRRNRKCASFGIATGRKLESALKVMKRYGIPVPDILITSVGTEIYYAPQLTADTAWTRHIDYQWNPMAIRRILRDLPGIKRQPKTQQSRFKLGYFIDTDSAPCLDEINSILYQEDQAVNTILSFGQFLDIIPIRASKGFALRYFADQWDIPLEHILVAGGSGADEDMMRGNTLAVVVANRHNEELSQLTDIDQIYFARKPHARGILEAVEYYDFYGSCRVPDKKKDIV